jgi:two-component system chemotaxis sensor kinase CheA
VKKKTGYASTDRHLEIKARYVDMMEGLVSDFAMYTHQITRDLERLNKTAKPTTQHWLKGMESDLLRFAHAFRQSCRRLHLVPLETVFQRFPREVRDLAKREGKKVNLVISGSDTEMEQHQLEKLAEAMTHLVRNAVDHGLETPDKRSEADKPETGRLSIAAGLLDGSVTIEIEDDGKGIDFPGLQQKAVELNIIKQDEIDRLPREKLMDLIFLTGISTTDISDTISGRGVGMDIVREAMEELGASINVKSSPGRGTRFTLTIPMDLKV